MGWSESIVPGTGPDIMYVATVFVDSNLRGQGLGKRLMNTVFAYSKSQGKHLVLACRPNNTGFYEKCGFHKIRFVPYCYAQETSNWLFQQFKWISPSKDDAYFMGRFLNGEKPKGLEESFANLKSPGSNTSLCLMLAMAVALVLVHKPIIKRWISEILG